MTPGVGWLDVVETSILARVVGWMLVLAEGAVRRMLYRNRFTLFRTWIGLRKWYYTGCLRIRRSITRRIRKGR